MKELKPGLEYSLSYTVTEKDTASAMRSGAADVYATPMMIAFMEHTCAESVLPFLDECENTVGIKVDVSHLASTPVGMKVTCHIKLIAVDRRKLTFSVQVDDELETIGQGTHERFVITSDKFMEKATNKLKMIKERNL